jgi:hypothetical protein
MLIIPEDGTPSAGAAGGVGSIKTPKHEGGSYVAPVTVR